MLFDNYYSRADLRSAFRYGSDRKKLNEEYKANRKREPKEFYNSLNLMRYYYGTCKPNYHVIQITGLEADDIVRTLVHDVIKGSALFITNDEDWCRYISETIHWLPDFSREPESSRNLEEKIGFLISEDSIILYKALFGDPSDNISAIISSSKENKKSFAEFVKEKIPLENIEAVIVKEDWQDKYPFLKVLDSQRRQLQINLQLISTLSLSEKNLRDHIITGKDDYLMNRSVREILGLAPSSKKFQFGNIKRPRAG